MTLAIPINSLAVVFLVALGASGQEPAALREIAAQEQQAVALKEQEKTAPGKRPQRIEAFRRAAALLSAHIQSLPDQNGRERLLLVCRLGGYCEDGELFEDARSCYAWCKQQHPWVDDSAVTYNRVPIAGYITRRIQAVDSRRVFAGVAPTGGWITIDRVVIHHLKGSISNVSHVAFGPAHAPLNENESLQVTLRRLPADQSVRAVRQGADLLGKQGIPVKTASRPGMVVFGVVSDQRDTDYLADSLDAARKSLVAAYFDAAASPSILSVYACLDRDPFLVEIDASRMCRAVHFREKSELEGYFQPLDNSIVLRKGVAVEADWYMGTAIHELTHALIYAEFPNAPRWLDEGLATIHEEQDASGPTDNYRLYYLLEALRQNKCPTVRDLIDPGADGWFGKKAPLFAAAARYLSLYLLQRDPGKNLLKLVYRRLRDDPAPSRDTSERVLQAVAGIQLAELDQAFVRFVRSRDAGRLYEKWGKLQGPIGAYVQDLPERPR